MPLIHSSKNRQQAIDLRQKGKSFRTIAKALKISLSTAHLWTKNVVLSDEQKNLLKYEHQRKLLSGRLKFAQYQKKLTLQREKQIFNKAKNEVLVRKVDPFFMTGLALYWAEGFKKDHSLGFVNSDPVMVKLFLLWVKKYYNPNVVNIHPRVQIHEIYQQYIQQIHTYWSRELEIPVSQFQKPFFQKSLSKPNYYDPKYRGLLRIRIIGSRDFFIKILGWIEGLKYSYLTNNLI